MTTLWKRFKYAIEADLQTVLEKKEEKNPIHQLNHYIKEAEKQTEKTGKWMERQGALKGKLEKELHDTEQLLAKRVEQLSLAELAGEEDLIVFAKQEVAAYEARKVTLQESLERTLREQLELEQKFEEMKHKVKDMKVRQLSLMGKENVTRAHAQMDRVLGERSSSKKETTIKTFDDLEHFIVSLGTKVDSSYSSSSMERRLDSLQKKQEDKQEIV
ncbi:PspA/IM30 family protein [Paenisporosarcina cavernae]|uniref:PspA/IM30 family protein n=1 Tax=Paenisporosarcina cavernae TaxID=2320858 RepID=A0A385YPK3_9BACL|nr:PspA/IM30 family protein [Paenisporosarcina cavernae]AYC28659.1 PspA/IM30 family protein [Paenisporosarcina cavernae]